MVSRVKERKRKREKRLRYRRRLEKRLALRRLVETEPLSEERLKAMGFTPGEIGTSHIVTDKVVAEGAPFGKSDWVEAGKDRGIWARLKAWLRRLK